MCMCKCRQASFACSKCRVQHSKCDQTAGLLDEAKGLGGSGLGSGPDTFPERGWQITALRMRVKSQAHSV